MTEKKTEKRPLLRGRENFLAWLTRLEGLLMIDGVIKKNEEGQLEVAETPKSKTKRKLKDTFSTIVTTLSCTLLTLRRNLKRPRRNLKRPWES
jgi:hypothetical protein